jgi:hypothetical protein
MPKRKVLPSGSPLEQVVSPLPKAHPCYNSSENEVGNPDFRPWNGRPNVITSKLKADLEELNQIEDPTSFADTAAPSNLILRIF